ncbi:MAG: hypothetical protein KKB21_02275 [Nanoarchaeota archaeon]|nr:hypothetical protein [Nanoarchaeota archaeon]
MGDKLSLDDLEELDFDNPTPEETELHQRMADEILFRRRADERDYQRARSLLSKTACVGTHNQRVEWMRGAGFGRVNVRGYSEPVDIERAPERNVRARYIREVRELHCFAEEYEDRCRQRQLILK